jgi:hypothetical protein
VYAQPMTRVGQPDGEPRQRFIGKDHPHKDTAHAMLRLDDAGRCKLGDFIGTNAECIAIDLCVVRADRLRRD